MSLTSLPRGFVLRDFVIEERIGRGGFGVVYRARRADREYAVKLPLLELSGGDEEDRARARERLPRVDREVSSLKSLKHPNVVTVAEFFSWNPETNEVGDAEEGLPIIVMPYINGPGIDEWVARTRPPLRAILAALRDVARALAEVHRRNFVHRDLKPSNILVEATGRPVLIDFGISRGRSTYTMTAVGDIVGTADYLAPEYLLYFSTSDFHSGKPFPYSGLQDLYALGHTFYSVLTGASAWAGYAEARANVASVAYRQMLRAGVIPPPSSVNPAIPVAVDALILKLLERRLRRRWQTGDELAKAVDALLASVPAPDCTYDEPFALPAATVREARVRESLEKMAALAAFDEPCADSGRACGGEQRAPSVDSPAGTTSGSGQTDEQLSSADLIADEPGKAPPDEYADEPIEIPEAAEGQDKDTPAPDCAPARAALKTVAPAPTVSLRPALSPAAAMPPPPPPPAEGSTAQRSAALPYREAPGMEAQAPGPFASPAPEDAARKHTAGSAAVRRIASAMSGLQAELAAVHGRAAVEPTRRWPTVLGAGALALVALLAGLALAGQGQAGPAPVSLLDAVEARDSARSRVPPAGRTEARERGVLAPAQLLLELEPEPAAASGPAPGPVRAVVAARRPPAPRSPDATAVDELLEREYGGTRPVVPPGPSAGDGAAPLPAFAMRAVGNDDRGPARLRAASADSEPGHAGRRFGVPMGTEFPARLMKPLDSRVTSPIVVAKLTRGLSLKGELKLPAGTMVYGTSSAAGGRFDVKLGRLKLPDGAEVPFEGLAWDTADRKPGLSPTRRIAAAAAPGPGLAEKVGRTAASTALGKVAGDDAADLGRAVGETFLGHQGSESRGAAQDALLLDAPADFTVFVTEAF